MSASLGAVVVGAGLMGRWHAHALARAGGAVMAVVDPDRSRARELADAHGARAAAALGDALEPGGARVVHVCTPTPTHEALIAEAMAAGMHVVAEKPVTAEPQATETLLAEAAARGVTLTPVHQFPFQRGVQSLLARPDRLGPLRHLEGVACSAGARGLDDAGKDRIAGEILPHFLSLLAAFVDAPLGDLEWRGHRAGAGELQATTVAAGVGVGIRVSMGGRPPRTTWEVTGERASAHADLFHGFAVVERGGLSRAWKALRPLSVSSRTWVGAAANLGGRALRREPAYPGLRTLLRETYRSIAAGGPGPISPEEVRGVARARRRILEAVGA